MENVCCLFDLVFHSVWHHLLVDARDQESHRKSKRIHGSIHNYTLIEIQLEELDDIFKSKNPVKASIAKRRLELDGNANIVGIRDLSDESRA